MEVDPIKQDELNKYRQKINTFENIYNRILDYRGVLEFTVILNDRVWKTSMPEEQADKLCTNWSAILYKVKRDLNDMEYGNSLISIQASTLHHELMIVDGTIEKDPEKRYTLVVHQWTPGSVIPAQYRALVSEMLSEFVPERDLSLPIEEFKELLWSRGEEPQVELSQDVHPVEKEALRKREWIRNVYEDNSGREMDILKRIVGTFSARSKEELGARKGYEYRGEKIVWPPSLDPSLTATEEKNLLDWMPEEAAEELEKLSINCETKERYRKLVKKKKYSGAIYVRYLAKRQKKLRQERQKKKIFSLKGLTD